jgi:hypothetical protein
MMLFLSYEGNDTAILFVGLIKTYFYIDAFKGTTKCLIP